MSSLEEVAAILRQISGQCERMAGETNETRQNVMGIVRQINVVTETIGTAVGQIGVIDSAIFDVQNELSMLHADAEDLQGWVQSVDHTAVSEALTEVSGLIGTVMEEIMVKARVAVEIAERVDSMRGALVRVAEDARQETIPMVTLLDDNLEHDIEEGLLAAKELVDTKIATLGL